MNLKGNCFWFLVATFLLITSCGRPVNSLFKDGVVKHTDVDSSVYKNSNVPHSFKYDSLKGEDFRIKYLGCGGFNIERGHRSILIDPYFSNQPILLRLSLSFLGFRTVKSDTKTIDNELEGLKKSELSSIWVSHSHYDHLLDVPYVYEQYGNDSSKIFCSQSGSNIIRGVKKIKSKNIVTLDKYATSHKELRKQYYTADSTVRVTPITSEHAPHLFWNIKFYKGEAEGTKNYNESTNHSRAEWWKEGMPFSFFFDYLETNGYIEFRIFIQPSAAAPFKGFIPEEVRDQHPINLAMLGAASFDYVDNYPEHLIEYLNPERLIICHWEDFFVKYNRKNKRKVRGTNVKEFIRRVNLIYPWKVNEVEKFILPKPGTIIKVEQN